MGFTYAYTDAVYTAFKGCAAGVDCTGKKVPFVPKNDLTVFAQYRFELANNGALTLHVDDAWASKFQVGPTNGQPLAIPHTAKKGILNASLTYEPPNAAWKFQVWGKTLTNEWYLAAPSNYYFYYVTAAEFAAGSREVDRGTINPPRQLGATLTYRF